MLITSFGSERVEPVLVCFYGTGSSPRRETTSPLSGFEKKMTLLGYQKVRQIVADGNQDRAAEIASEHGLSSFLQDITVTVAKDWPSRDPNFFVVMSGVFEGGDASSLARALAAEGVSTWYSHLKDEAGTQEWSDRALALVPELDEADGELLTRKINAGLYDRGLLELDLDGLREIIAYMVEVGAFDVPGRVKAWLEEFEQEERVALLREVTALSVEETSVNIYYMGWCQKKLEELTA